MHSIAVLCRARYAIAYAILITSAFNYGACAWANKHSSPILVTSFFPLQLVFTALFAWLFLGQVPSRSDYIGSPMVIAGLVCVSLGKRLQQADDRAT